MRIFLFSTFLEEKKLPYKPWQRTLRLLPLSICCLELLRVTNLITSLGIEGIGPKRAQALAREYKTLDNLLEALPIKGRAKYIQNLNAGHEN